VAVAVAAGVVGGLMKTRTTGSTQTIVAGKVVVGRRAYPIQARVPEPLMVLVAEPPVVAVVDPVDGRLVAETPAVLGGLRASAAGAPLGRLETEMAAAAVRQPAEMVTLLGRQPEHGTAHLINRSTYGIHIQQRGRFWGHRIFL
jgi:hypothetical protein